MADEIEYSDDIRLLIESLHTPRYATGEDTLIAPICFDGVLQGSPVTFVATRMDPHDYCRDTWERAQTGYYGPIGVFVQPVPPPVEMIPWPPPPAQRDAGVNAKVYELFQADLDERKSIKERLDELERAVERLSKARNGRKPAP